MSKKQNRYPNDILVGRTGVLVGARWRQAKRMRFFQGIGIASGFLGVAVIAVRLSWPDASKMERESAQFWWSNPSHVSLKTEIETSNLDKFSDQRAVGGGQLQQRQISFIQRASRTDLQGNLRRSKNIQEFELAELQNRYDEILRQIDQSSDDRRWSFFRSEEGRVIATREGVTQQLLAGQTKLLKERELRDENIRETIAGKTEKLIQAVSAGQQAKTQ